MRGGDSKGLVLLQEATVFCSFYSLSSTPVGIRLCGGAADVPSLPSPKCLRATCNQAAQMTVLPAFALFLSNFLEQLCVHEFLRWPNFFFFLSPTDSSSLSHCADVQKRRGTFAYMQSLTKCAERCNLFLGKLFSFSPLTVFLSPVLPVYYVKGTFHFSNKIAIFFTAVTACYPVYLSEKMTEVFLCVLRLLGVVE